MDRRLSINALLIANLILSLCVLVAVPWSLDRLGDRLTASISAEAHSQMWEQIRLNHQEQNDAMLLFESQTFDRLEVQELQGEAWWRRVIQQHPELGDKQ